jgi:hypothetical protein
MNVYTPSVSSKSSPSYFQLKPAEQESAQKHLRETFAPILTSWQVSEARAHILGQLQLAQQFRQPILQFKIQFDVFRSDRAIKGKKLILHKVYFWTKPHPKELGDYIEMPFSLDQLYQIDKQLSGSRPDLQVLMIDPKLATVLNMEHLRPYLPDQLQHLQLDQLQAPAQAPALASKSSSPASPIRHVFSGHDVHLLGMA